MIIFILCLLKCEEINDGESYSKLREKIKREKEEISKIYESIINKIENESKISEDLINNLNQLKRLSQYINDIILLQTQKISSIELKLTQILNNEKEYEIKNNEINDLKQKINLI